MQVWRQSFLLGLWFGLELQVGCLFNSVASIDRVVWRVFVQVHDQWSFSWWPNCGKGSLSWL